MFKKIITPLLLLATSLFYSCGNSYVLTTEQMQELLVDIHLADGLGLQQGDFNTPTLKNNLYNQIYKKHNTTAEQFDSSLVYYSENMEELVEIYDVVVERLKTIEEKVNKGDFAAINGSVNKTTNARVVTADMERLPYINNEYWNQTRDYVFTEEQLDSGVTATVIIDTMEYNQLELRFDISAKGITKATCKMNVSYTDTIDDKQTIELPLNGENPFVYSYTTLGLPDTIVYNFIVEKDTIEDISFSVKDCRLYEISPNAHSIKLFE